MSLHLIFRFNNLERELFTQKANNIFRYILYDGVFQRRAGRQLNRRCRLHRLSGERRAVGTSPDIATTGSAERVSEPLN